MQSACGSPCRAVHIGQVRTSACASGTSLSRDVELKVTLGAGTGVHVLRVPVGRVKYRLVLKQIRPFSPVLIQTTRFGMVGRGTASPLFFQPKTPPFSSMVIIIWRYTNRFHSNPRANRQASDRLKQGFGDNQGQSTISPRKGANDKKPPQTIPAGNKECSRWSSWSPLTRFRRRTPVNPKLLER